jgi:hypothetical protein
MKTGSKSEKFITKMISVKSSTNPESFIGFGRGHRIDWRNPMDIPYCHLIYIREYRFTEINFQTRISCQKH